MVQREQGKLTQNNCDVKTVKYGTKLRLKKLKGTLKMPSWGQAGDQLKCLENMWDILSSNTKH